MAVAKTLPNTTKIINEVRHGCRDRLPRLFYLHCCCSACCRCPMLMIMFLLRDSQACDLMDEAIRVQATTEGQLDTSI